MRVFTTLFGMVACLLVVILYPVHAAQPFGTSTQARTIITSRVDTLETGGLQAEVAALYDGDGPFLDSRMGIHFFAGPYLVGDNREPQAAATDYRNIHDLTWRSQWPRIPDSAVSHAEYVLRWYHYDTQEDYTFRCQTGEAAGDAVYHVMACR